MSGAIVMSERARAPQGLARSEMWRSFWIGPDADRIVLVQKSARHFELRSNLWFDGELGIAVACPDVERRLRSVGPETLPDTDLASVPAPFRWWVNSYGQHTPAALIHDRFIGNKDELERLEGITEQQIDRYFRFMLASLGIGVVRRWLIWSAVAVRTRLMSGIRRRIAMGVWFAAMAVGLLLVARAAQGSNEWWLPATLPLVVAPLWGRQWGAGLAIAYLGIPAMFVPSVLAALGIISTAALDAFCVALGELRSAWREVGRRS